MRMFSGLIILAIAVYVSAQIPSDFTGHWQQQSTSGVQRQLEAEQKGESLRVKTVVTNSEGTRNLEVKYQIGGAATTYKGLDGDEFRSSIRWDGNALVFDTIEHEEGSEIPQKAIWTLSEDGNQLRVDRQVTKSGKPAHSLTTYVRQP